MSATPGPRARDTHGDGAVEDEPPPVLGSWPRLYALVLLFLGALIVLFYAFGQFYE